MQHLVEIMLYTLRPGTGGEFLAIMQNESAPLHLQADIDIVWHGQSHHDPDCYGLIRAFKDMEGLEQQLAHFYASDAWRLGPREAIVSRILETVKIVIPMDASAIEAIRRQGYFNAGRLRQVS